MTPEEATKLRTAFPRSAIGKLPRGGVMLDYVGHAATTDRLLAVDPDWSWEPFSLDERGLPALDAEGNLWIRLTVCGVTRPGVGDGKTAKERIGDAIRNAAMRFGVALDLWAKEDLQSQNGNGPEHHSEDQPGASSSPLASAHPDASDAPAPIGNTIAASTRDKTATQAQRSKLGVYVAWLREDSKQITTADLYRWVAKHRGVELVLMTDLTEHAYDEQGVLHWGPLLKTLTRAEAHALIDALVAKYGEAPVKEKA